MILDVGCGGRPRGDINVDTDPNSDANIIASAEHLPFRDNSFDAVLFRGLLHHLKDPEAACREMTRVVRTVIIGEEPSKFNPGVYFDPSHTFKGFWKHQIEKFLQGLSIIISLDYKFYFGFHMKDCRGMLPIRIPPLRINIKVVALKRQSEG